MSSNSLDSYRSLARFRLPHLLAPTFRIVRNIISPVATTTELIEAGAAFHNASSSSSSVSLKARLYFDTCRHWRRHRVLSHLTLGLQNPPTGRCFHCCSPPLSSMALPPSTEYQQPSASESDWAPSKSASSALTVAPGQWLAKFGCKTAGEPCRFLEIWHYPTYVPLLCSSISSLFSLPSNVLLWVAS